MNTALALRDPRLLLSKTFIQQVSNCGQRAWYQIHDPRPWVAPEKVTFGSAVDAGVEAIIRSLRDTGSADVVAAAEVAMEKVADDANQPDPREVATALVAFTRWDVLRHADLRDCVTQAHLRGEVQGLGEVDSHPDLILSDGSIRDVKTSGRAKGADEAATSFTELALYALVAEAFTGTRPPTVGYWTWVRTARPWWQEVVAPVTDRMLSVAWQRAAMVAGAIEADQLLNDGVAVPVNRVFTAPPRYGCSDCQWLPDCPVAEEVTDVAA